MEDRDQEPTPKQQFAKKNAIYFAIAGALFIIAGIWGNLNVVLIAIGAVNIIMGLVFWRRSQS